MSTSNITHKFPPPGWQTLRTSGSSISFEHIHLTCPTKWPNIPLRFTPPKGFFSLLWKELIVGGIGAEFLKRQIWIHILGANYRQPKECEQFEVIQENSMEAKQITTKGRKDVVIGSNGGCVPQWTNDDEHVLSAHTRIPNIDWSEWGQLRPNEESIRLHPAAFIWHHIA